MAFIKKIKLFLSSLVYNPVTSGLFRVLKSFIPGVLGNLVSDILGRWFQIDTPAGTGMVLSAAIAALLVALRHGGNSAVSRIVPPDSYVNGKMENETMMEGSLYTVALFVQNLCGNFLQTPLTPDTLVTYLVPLIPAVEGAASSMLMARHRHRMENFVTSLIYQSLDANQFITERMLTNMIMEKFSKGMYKYYPAQFLRPMVRKQMLSYLEVHGYKLFNSILTMNTLEFDNWKIRRIAQAPTAPKK